MLLQAGLRGAPLGVERQDLGRLRGQPAPTQPRIEHRGIVADGFQVMHARLSERDSRSSERAVYIRPRRRPVYRGRSARVASSGGDGTSLLGIRVVVLAVIEFLLAFEFTAQAITLHPDRQPDGDLVQNYEGNGQAELAYWIGRCHDCRDDEDDDDGVAP